MATDIGQPHDMVFPPFLFLLYSIVSVAFSIIQNTKRNSNDEDAMRVTASCKIEEVSCVCMIDGCKLC